MAHVREICYADDGTGTLLDPLPMMAYQPESPINAILQNDNFTSAPWYREDLTFTKNQSGIRNVVNSAWLTTDNDIATTGYFITDHITISPLNSWITLVFWVAKTTNATSFPGIMFQRLNGAAKYHRIGLDTDNGTAELSGYDIRVTSDGDFWKYIISIEDEDSNTAARIVFNPALNDDASTSPDITVTGDAVFDCPMLFIDTHPDDIVNIGPIYTDASTAATDETINTYPSANWSNSEGPIYLIHDYKGIDEDILLNDDVPILYVTSDVLYLDDGTNTTSIAYATEGEHEIGIALDATNGFMRLNVNGTWAD